MSESAYNAMIEQHEDVEPLTPEQLAKTWFDRVEDRARERRYEIADYEDAIARIGIYRNGQNL